MSTKLENILNIQYPIIMAPMFLVTNELMLQNAMKSGVMGVFPSLNYRDEGQLGQVLDGLNEFKKDVPGNYGVNLIVQKANPFYEKHLAICIEKKVPFFITSLGNPKEVIEKAHAYGGKVFCDVVNLEHAKKCASYNCDGFIAVGQGAGGHAGNNSLQVLIPALRKVFPNIPVVGAGGISSGAGLLSIQALGAIGASIGTRFIASEEASVSAGYKEAIVKSGMEDIVLTERLSGTPCTIIETPYSKKIGYKQNWFERLMNKNKKVRKYYKMLVQSKGMKKLEKSVKPGNYNNLWCAGQSVELISDVKSIDAIVQSIMREHSEARKNLMEI
jgi:nitronate monooxygenase